MEKVSPLIRPRTLEELCAQASLPLELVLDASEEEWQEISLKVFRNSIVEHAKLSLVRTNLRIRWKNGKATQPTPPQQQDRGESDEVPMPHADDSNSERKGERQIGNGRGDDSKSEDEDADDVDHQHGNGNEIEREWKNERGGDRNPGGKGRDTSPIVTPAKNAGIAARRSYGTPHTQNMQQSPQPTLVLDSQRHKPRTPASPSTSRHSDGRKRASNQISRSPSQECARGAGSHKKQRCRAESGSQPRDAASAAPSHPDISPDDQPTSSQCAAGSHENSKAPSPKRTSKEKEGAANSSVRKASHKTCASTSTSRAVPAFSKSMSASMTASSPLSNFNIFHIDIFGDILGAYMTTRKAAQITQIPENKIIESCEKRTDLGNIAFRYNGDQHLIPRGGNEEVIVLGSHTAQAPIKAHRQHYPPHGKRKNQKEAPAKNAHSDKKTCGREKHTRGKGGCLISHLNWKPDSFLRRLFRRMPPLQNAPSEEVLKACGKGMALNLFGETVWKLLKTQYGWLHECQYKSIRLVYREPQTSGGRSFSSRAAVLYHLLTSPKWQSRPDLRAATALVLSDMSTMLEELAESDHDSNPSSDTESKDRPTLDDSGDHDFAYIRIKRRDIQPEEIEQMATDSGWSVFLNEDGMPSVRKKRKERHCIFGLYLSGQEDSDRPAERRVAAAAPAATPVIMPPKRPAQDIGMKSAPVPGNRLATANLPRQRRHHDQPMSSRDDTFNSESPTLERAN